MRADNGATFNIFYIDPTSGVLDVPIRAAYFDYYVRGTTRTEQIRIQYIGSENPLVNSLQPTLAGLKFGIVWDGGTWRLGSEFVSEGFLSARLLPDGEFVALSDTDGPLLGDLGVGDYVDIELKLVIPEPYPLTEVGDVRHGAVYFKLGFIGGDAINDPARASLYLSAAYGGSAFLSYGDPSIKESNPKDVDWFVFKATIFTAAEALELSDIFTFPDDEGD